MTARVPVMFASVVVATQVGTPFTRARWNPLVPADVVEIAPEPLPRMMELAWMLVQPVPPCDTPSVPPMPEKARPREVVPVSVYPLDELPTRIFPYEGAVVNPVPP